MPTDLQMLLLGVPYLTLLMQRLGQQTTYCNSFSTILYCLNIRLSNVPGNLSEPQRLLPDQQHPPWPRIVQSLIVTSPVPYPVLYNLCCNFEAESASNDLLPKWQIVFIFGINSQL